MIKYITYYRNSGEIQSWGQGFREAFPYIITDTVGVIEHTIDDVTTHTHYVDGSEIKPRPVMPVQINKYNLTADGVDSITVILPLNSKIVIDAEEYLCTDGVFEFVTLHPGGYLLEINNFPFISTILEVTAL